jgi:hypothetical protein
LERVLGLAHHLVNDFGRPLNLENNECAVASGDAHFFKKIRPYRECAMQLNVGIIAYS